MSYTSGVTAQERRNALMERILLRKFNVMETEYDKMKNAENRLRIKHEIQARIDKSNPEFDPNVKIEYNPEWATNENKDTDDEDENETPLDIHPQNNENDTDKIHLSEDGIDKIKSLMEDMPSLNAPDWANKIPEDIWKTKLLNTLEEKKDNNNEKDGTQTQAVLSQSLHTQSKPETQDNKKKTESSQNKPLNSKKKQSKSKNKQQGKGRNKTKNRKNNKKSGGPKNRSSKRKSKKRTK